MTKAKKKRFHWQAHKPLLATALAVAGVFNMVGAVLADTTPANTDISNTATGTYNDGKGNNFNAVSNTVVITVAEVAGLTVTQSGFNDSNGGSIVTNDEVSFDFLVANVGNADTYVYVPGADQIDVTNGTISKVEIVDGSNLVAVPGSVGTPSNDTANSTEALLSGTNSGKIAAGTSFTVRVTVKVTANTVGQKISVQFGNTSDNTTLPANSTQNQQNIPDSTDAVTLRLKDVRTLNEGANAPVNGEREAADFREEEFATSATRLAQALILKQATYSNSTTPANPADDKIAYGLELRVGNRTFPSVDPGKLAGTDIKVNAVSVSRILVSDAIPVGTVSDSSVTPTAPANWTVVYSRSPLNINALDAEWDTNPPLATDIKRVGFIYDPATPNSALAPSTTVTGFNFTVVTSGISAPGGIVANIAQVFGETEGDSNNNLVYDESGDQQPNNFNDGFTPTNNTTTFDSVNDLGIADPNDPETTPNANDGSGPDGESNVVTITTQPLATGGIFNGPSGSPAATGPNNINDDFTNVAVSLGSGDTLGIQGTSTNPPPIDIINTVQNPSATSRLDTVTLLPLAPSQADTATSTSGNYGADSNLPNGTLVTIAFGGKFIEYEYTVTNNVGTFAPSTNPNNSTTPIRIGTLNAGVSQNYTVTIDLPAGTGQPNETQQVQGYGVPIVAFVDNNNDGDFTSTTETVANITINRAYTGFMKLTKEARVIYAARDGVTLSPSIFSDKQSDLEGFNLRPGDSIEYRVTYENISKSAPAGGGNVVLNARNFTVVEDGAASGNNWGTNTLHQIGTTFSRGTATYTTPSGSVSADPANGAAVSAYTNAVGTVAPETNGTLTFIRKVN